MLVVRACLVGAMRLADEMFDDPKVSGEIRLRLRLGVVIRWVDSCASASDYIMNPTGLCFILPLIQI